MAEPWEQHQADMAPWEKYGAAEEPIATPSFQVPEAVERRKLSFKPTGEAFTPEQRRTEGKRIAREQISPILETGGMVVGGIAGAPLGPAGVIAGAGTGYAAGERVAGALGGQEVKPIGEEIKEFGKSALTGAALEATGIGAGKVIGKVAEVASKSLYNRAVKLSTRLSRPEKSKIIEAGLDNAIFPTEKGLIKLEGKIDAVNQGINKAIKRAAVKGEVQTSKVVSEIEKVKGRFADDIDFLDEIAPDLDKLKDRVLALGPTMTAQKAQNMKVLAYKSLKGKYGELKNSTIEGKKGLAKGLMQEIESLVPDIKGLNKKHATMRGLEEQVARAANRISNRELFSLFTAITAAGGGAYAGGGEGALTYGILAQLITSPRSKVAMGVAINKALKASGATTTARRALGPLLLPNKE